MAHGQPWEQEFEQAGEVVRTVRIVILGDPGVGKTAVTNLLARSPITPTRSSRTVANSQWSVQVRVHECPHKRGGWTSYSSWDESRVDYHRLMFPRAPPVDSGATYFVEFYDKNSSVSQCRVDKDPLFGKMDGIVLVYNMKDMRSQDHLDDWLFGPLCEIRRQRKHKHRSNHPHVPILVVGTMLDRLPKRRPYRSFTIAHQLGAQEMFINCLDPHSFDRKTRNRRKVNKFLDKAVDWMHSTK